MNAQTKPKDDDFQFEIEGDEQEQSEVEAKSKPSVDIEIEDDTPEEDRNRTPLPKEIVERLELDELDQYSDEVKTKLKQLKKSECSNSDLKKSCSIQKSYNGLIVSINIILSFSL